MTKSNSQTYEKMLKDVEAIVQDINSDNVDLDQMVKKVETGYELIKKMKEKLKATKENIDKLREEYEQEES